MTSKVVLITGTSSGFGLLTAVRLASRGHRVYATMRDPGKRADLDAALRNAGAEASVLQLDVTKLDTVADVMRRIETSQGRLDAVINNAGFGMGGFFEDLAEEDIRRQMEVNFFGVQRVCRAAIPLMRRQGSGMIINISSIAGQSGTPSLGAYNASKWALEGFSESLYHELRPFGIRVVIVEPGSYPTKIFSDNARYGKSFDDPASPYYPYSQKLKAFVGRYLAHSKRDPDRVARLIERIVHSPNPRLRYVSDFSSWCRIWAGRMIPASVYYRIFQKFVYQQ